MGKVFMVKVEKNKFYLKQDQPFLLCGPKNIPKNNEASLDTHPKYFFYFKSADDGNLLYNVQLRTNNYNKMLSFQGCQKAGLE